MMEKKGQFSKKNDLKCFKSGRAVFGRPEKEVKKKVVYYLYYM